MNLTPKHIIIGSLKSKLEGTGINRIIFTFIPESEKYNLMVQNIDGSDMHLDIEQNDINTIKTLFIRGIIKAWNKKYKIPAKCIIIQFDVTTEKFDVFIQDNKNKIFKFDY
jgi:hypothetical protein